MAMRHKYREYLALFESLLDVHLALISPAWRLPEIPEGYVGDPDFALRWRTERKRFALAKALKQAPDEVRNHRDGLFHVVVHDQNPSFNYYLIMPIVNAIGRHELYEALIGYLQSGTYVERLCALKAWYQAQPGLFYASSTDYHRGEPNPDRMAEYNAWVALRPRFLAACEAAVEACDTPEEREQLADLARSVARAEIVTIGDPGPPDRP
jgi:hypothetical protein